MTTLNLTRSIENLVADIVRTVPDFKHIETGAVMICVSSTRGAGVHGTFAKIHPLRFPGGSLTQETRRGLRKITYRMPEITHRGRDILYVIYFLVPRFLNLPFREKLITIFHELYHISPQFDGDLRRFPGRNYAHGSSTKKYNALMSRFVEDYLATADEGPLSFLDGDMNEIRGRYRAIVGRKMTMPRIRMERK
jgi:hypothetical protein